MRDFDEQAYLALNPDVALAVNRGDFASGHQHWLLHGQNEGRVCSFFKERFDELGYLIKNPDVLAGIRAGAFKSGWDHWVRSGLVEGRDSSQLQLADRCAFDDRTYVAANPDVAAAVRAGVFKSGYDHWFSCGRFEGRPGAPPRGNHVPSAELPNGVNYFGFLSAPTGLGVAARGYLSALRDLPIPLHPVEVPTWSGVPGQPLPFEAPFAINLIHQNADMMPLWALAYEQALHGRYNIGLWVWELPAPGISAHRASKLVDEIWVPSRFVRDSIACVCTCPAFRIPYVVEGFSETGHHGREHFGIDPNTFVALYVFDVSSGFQRKNPLAAIQAFRLAFGNSRKATLLLKYSGANHDPAGAGLIERLAAESPGVRTISGPLSEAEMQSLYSIADCFLSPHRSEGFGLGIATAMYYGKPAIATRFSGNLEFMEDENSYLADFDIASVGPGNEPYDASQVWANPDVQHLSQLLVEIESNREAASIRAEEGSKRIRRDFSANAIGAMVNTRLQRVLG